MHKEWAQEHTPILMIINICHTAVIEIGGGNCHMLGIHLCSSYCSIYVFNCSLAWNTIGPIGGEALAEALTVNQTLQKLRYM